MSAASPTTEPLFTVSTAWCGDVILTTDRWNHICDRHPELEPHMELVRLTLEKPNIVSETPYAKPTYAFYKREVLAGVPRYGDCYVAVFVRYTMQPAQAWTAYFPIHLSANMGRVLHLERKS
jgi:hypothetical protein